MRNLFIKLLKYNRNVCHNCIATNRFLSTGPVHELKPQECSRVQNTCNFPEPVFDMDYYCNRDNRLEIEENIKKRKVKGDINYVLQLHDSLQNCKVDSDDYCRVNEELQRELGKLPNKLHKMNSRLSDKPGVIKTLGAKKEYNYKVKNFLEISKNLRIARTENLSHFTNHRSYYFMGQLADMESALVRFSLKNLLSRNFHLISVPDILDKKVVEACGMDTQGERTQVYGLDEKYYGTDLCLSGTAEMGIAGYLMNRTFTKQELPLRLAAVSRCYRAETSRIADERGIFRVHNFTKVEMFGVSEPDKSDELLEEFREIEESAFETLGLFTQVLEIPPSDLGPQACRKYDIEAWMPGGQLFGEISSCSNCTDYQSRRLNIKCGDKFVHTVNGTACAVPRMLIAILETFQNKNWTVNIPKVLQPYMDNMELISLNRNIPKMRPYKTNQVKK